MRRQEKTEERYTREHVLLMLLAPARAWAAELLVEAVEVVEAVEALAALRGKSAAFAGGAADVREGWLRVLSRPPCGYAREGPA